VDRGFSLSLVRYGIETGSSSQIPSGYSPGTDCCRGCEPVNELSHVILLRALLFYPKEFQEDCSIVADARSVGGSSLSCAPEPSEPGADVSESQGDGGRDQMIQSPYPLEHIRSLLESSDCIVCAQDALPILGDHI